MRWGRSDGWWVKTVGQDSIRWGAPRLLALLLCQNRATVAYLWENTKKQLNAGTVRPAGIEHWWNSTSKLGLGTIQRMSEQPLNVLAVVGSLQSGSVTRAVVLDVAQRMQESGCAVDLLDFLKEPLALYNPDTAHDLPGYIQLQQRVDRADVILLGTPDYHGSLSGAMKNFLDHFWHEFAGKLFVTIVASHEKGLTVTDQLRTVARQCYAWSLPYGIAFTEELDVKEGKIISDALQKRLDMLVRDARVYGELLARQRRADLAGTDRDFWPGTETLTAERRKCSRLAVLGSAEICTADTPEAELSIPTRSFAGPL